MAQSSLVRGVALASLLTLAAAAVGFEDKKVNVREINVAAAAFKDAQPRGEATKPTALAAADDLAKVIGDKELLAKLKKDVDFTKEQLLAFTWTGSGTDRLTFKVEDGKKGAEVVFLYQRGATDDVKAHHRLFALPKGTAWKVTVVE